MRAAEAALATRRFATPIDVLVGIRWVSESAVSRWRQGRLADLEGSAQVDADRLSAAMRLFRGWAQRRGLRPSETTYVASTRDRRPLRFSASGDPEIEQAYRTHWVAPELSEREEEQVAERLSRPKDVVVISALNDWTCALCGGTGSLLLMEDAGPVCLACADMDHLAYLPSGDGTLSRRAKKASRLSAVVVRFSRSRRRYERQGILVEEEALAKAERDCLADEEARARGRLRAAARREVEDVEFQARLARRILELFPGCPPERAETIARHTGARGSGRVGRTAGGRALEAEAVAAAVGASVRHEDTSYDDLLMSGVPRDRARERVGPRVDEVLEGWRRA
ncbi:MAG TPA: DUF2293 domain-containing protein [Candidatus Dormibacteraeota bacterium]|nr:DUF2293 domain-containing protein [Candidatus Dormibacteraeota bacterium]